MTVTGKFSNLLYRDFYMMRKQIIVALISFAGSALFCALILLSIRFGNLSKMAEMVQIDGEEAELMLANMLKGAIFVAKILPSVMCAMIPFAVTNLTNYDEDHRFRLFMKSTPLTPVRRSLVRSCTNLICTVGGLALAIGYMFIVGLLTGEGLSYEDVSTLTGIFIFYTVFTLIAQLAIMRMHNNDKAMLLILGVAVVAVFIISRMMPKPEGEDDNPFGLLLRLAQDIFPFTPVIIIVGIAIYFGVSVYLYQRREK